MEQGAAPPLEAAFASLRDLRSEFGDDAQLWAEAKPLGSRRGGVDPAAGSDHGDGEGAAFGSPLREAALAAAAEMARCRAEFQALVPALGGALEARLESLEVAVASAAAAVGAAEEGQREAAVAALLPDHMPLELLAPLAEACCFFGLPAVSPAAAAVRDFVALYAALAEDLFPSQIATRVTDAAAVSAAWAFRSLAVLLHATTRCDGLAASHDDQHALAAAIGRIYESAAVRKAAGRDVLFGRAHVVGKAMAALHAVGASRTPEYRAVCSDFCDVKGVNRRLHDPGFDASLAVDTIAALAVVDDFRRGRTPDAATQWLARVVASGGPTRKNLLRVQAAAGLLRLRFEPIEAALEARVAGDGAGVISSQADDTAQRGAMVTDTTADYTALEGSDLVYSDELADQRSDWAAT